MSLKFRLKLAKRHEAKPVADLLSIIDEKTKEEEVAGLIEKKRIFVLKDKKRVKAVFCYTVFGLLGIFAIMYISRLAVVPELQGQGIGTLLLSRIKTLSLKSGAAAFFLFSRRAKGFYKKNKLRNIGSFFWWRKQID